MRRLFSLACSMLLAINAYAAEDASRKNWFDDPFFQVRGGVAQCPVPLGPFLTEAEKIAESHSRIERGTSCWLAGTCAEPNAYLYDKTIARSIQDQFDRSEAFRDASLWITVKRKFAWVEGCVANPAQAGTLDSFLKTVSDLERVLLNVMSPPFGKPPYAVQPDR